MKEKDGGKICSLAVKNNTLRHTNDIDDARNHWCVGSLCLALFCIMFALNKTAILLNEAFSFVVNIQAEGLIRFITYLLLKSS